MSPQCKLMTEAVSIASGAVGAAFFCGVGRPNVTYSRLYYHSDPTSF